MKYIKCFYQMSIVMMLFVSQATFSQTDIPEENKYLNQPPPGDVPVLFAPEIMKSQVHCNPTFSPDGTEIYWSSVCEDDEHRRLKYMIFREGKWSEPQTAAFTEPYDVDQPFMSYDGQKLYYALHRSTKDYEKERHNLWYSDRTEDGWSSPKEIGGTLNSPKFQWTPSLSRSNTLCLLAHLDGVSRNDGIFLSYFRDGRFATPEPLPNSINGKTSHDWCPFIAPDESYIIFSSTRAGGYGSHDLYISFKDKDGGWLEPINMGEKVNTRRQERFPGISPDGKYFFFTRGKGGPCYHDLYWVDADFIEELKNK